MKDSVTMLEDLDSVLAINSRQCKIRLQGGLTLRNRFFLPVFRIPTITPFPLHEMMKYKNVDRYHSADAYSILQVALSFLYHTHTHTHARKKNHISSVPHYNFHGNTLH